MANAFVFIPSGSPWTDPVTSVPYRDGQIHLFDSQNPDQLAAANRIIDAGAGFDVAALVSALLQIPWGNISSKPSSFAPSAHTHTAADIVSGILDAARIPDLDATKLVSGVLSALRIPDLDASKITTGFLATSRIPNLAAAKITSGVLDVLRIPDLDAAKIITGVLDTGRIPDLDAAKISSGIFALARIPDLPASKVTSGEFDVARVPMLPSSKVDATSGAFPLALIPSLPAAQITSGTLSTSRIPNLATSKITSGTFADARISASSVTQHQGALTIDLSQLTGMGAFAGISQITTSAQIAAGVVEEANLSASVQEKLNRSAKNNFSATADPTVNDDAGDGYSEGSVWINTVTDEAFRLVDDTPGAAVWRNSTLTADELGTLAFQNANAVNITGGAIAVSSVTVGGNAVWHAGNFDPSLKLNVSTYTAADVLAKLLTVDGPGSGLDADTLDGQHASSFVRSDENDTVTGLITIDRSGEMLRFGASGTLNSSDGHILLGALPLAWMVKYVGSTTGTDGNELRFESANTGRYWQFDHDGNFEFYNGAATFPVWTGANFDPASKSNVGHGHAFTEITGVATTAQIPSLPASQITSGTFASARISQDSVTQHQGALSIGWGQLTSVPSFYTTTQVDDALALKANLTDLPYASIAQYSSTDTTTDLAAGATVRWNSTVTSDSAITVGGANNTEISVVEAGKYLFKTRLVYQDTSADGVDVNNTLGATITVNGVSTGRQAVGSPVLNTNGANEGQVVLEELLSLQPGDVVRVTTQRLSGGDELYLISGQSSLIVERVGGKSPLLAAQTITDIQGLQAALDDKLSTSGGTMRGELAGDRDAGLTGFLMPQNPEGAHIKSPFFFNDLAFARQRGANVLIAIDGVDSGIGASTIDRLFNTSADYVSLNVNGVSEVKITITNVPKTLTFGAYMGVVFGNQNWRASGIVLERSTDGGVTWTVARSVTGHEAEFLVNSFNDGATGANAFRYTFTDFFNLTTLRITSLFAYNYNSSGMQGLYMGRDGGEVFGSLQVNGVLQPGSDAALQVNGFMRTGPIYLHETSGGVPTVQNKGLLNTGGNLKWDGQTVFHEGNFNPATKANASHTHTISDVTGLQDALDNAGSTGELSILTANATLDTSAAIRANPVYVNASLTLTVTAPTAGWSQPVFVARGVTATFDFTGTTVRDKDGNVFDLTAPNNTVAGPAYLELVSPVNSEVEIWT